ncbi:MAG: large subunit ribosomal protein L31 [Rhodothermales bacterium]|jgi:large subunit ribosomal protein L31
MKTDIHPTVHKDATITCACGAVYAVSTTRPEAKVSICAGCHPFFTGKKKFVDTEGRVDRFRRRYQMEAGAEEE